MKNTETTFTIVEALRAAKSLDTDKLFASAIDVAVIDYTKGTAIVERVSIPGEFFGPVRAALVDALALTLSRRLEWLRRDLALGEQILMQLEQENQKP